MDVSAKLRSIRIRIYDNRNVPIVSVYNGSISELRIMKLVPRVYIIGVNFKISFYTSGYQKNACYIISFIYGS